MGQTPQEELRLLGESVSTLADKNKSESSDQGKKKSFKRSWRSSGPVAKLTLICTAITALAGVLYFIAYVVISVYQGNQSGTNFQASQRAYVTLGRKDGVVASFVQSADHPDENADLVLYFQNSGHVQAKLAWGIFGLPIIAQRPGTGQQSSGIHYNHPFTGLPTRIRDRKTGAIGAHSPSKQGSQDLTIPAESTVSAPIGGISAQDLKELPGKDVLPMIMGRFEYCDELGTHVSHQFELGYRNAATPDLDFYVFHDAQVSNLPIPTSSDEIAYLPPCETIEETQWPKPDSMTQRVCRLLRLCK